MELKSKSVSFVAFKPGALDALLSFCGWILTALTMLHGWRLFELVCLEWPLGMHREA